MADFLPEPSAEWSPPTAEVVAAAVAAFAGVTGQFNDGPSYSSIG